MSRHIKARPESNRTYQPSSRGKNFDPFTRRNYSTFRMEAHYRPRFSHIVLCPVRDSSGVSIVEKDVDDLISHGRSLVERLERHRRNNPVMIRADYKDPRPNIAKVKEVDRAGVIYVVGHCNGHMFGSQHYGVIDFDATRMADWLEKTGLMRPGVTVKLMGCRTASICECGDIPFASAVASKLRVRGVKIAGYDGSVKESKRLGGLHSCSAPLFSLFDRDRDRSSDRAATTSKGEELLRASDVRVSFRS
ncbi:MAG: hypothetical protein P1U34_09595 [Coxiellaceae bacterium]|nr:hypothetical protein [Coxiellaceae bacterium]